MSNWKIVKEQDDPQALRLSIGAPHEFNIEENGYVVYRGDTQQCIDLLEVALERLKQHKEQEDEL